MHTAKTPRSSLRLLAAAILGAGMSLSLSLGALATEVGKPAPEFQLPSDDKTIKLADYKGKVVYIDFWASWCGPCRQSFPWMNEMQTKYGAQGFTVLAINVDQKRADAQKFLAESPSKFTIAYDDKGVTPKAYAVKTMPTSMLIGTDGVVKVIHRGFRADETQALEQQIRTALGK
ncbi:MAG: TlpA family protein disulfide reductase [Burkholderiales bacterium]